MAAQLQQITVRPVCSIEAANGSFLRKYLTRGDYDLLIKENTRGVTERGETCFVYLRGLLSADGTLRTFRRLRRLNYSDVTTSNYRRAFRHSFGGHLLFGYWNGRATAPTRKFRSTYLSTIVPLCLTLRELLQEYWPEAARAQERLARTNGSLLIGAELKLFTNAGPQFLYSTVTVNHSVVCPSHADKRNAGGPAALTAFGQWTGAELCFPRLRVAFPLRPGDVLFADTITEQHGNTAPLIGPRISCVCYLRAMKARQ